MMKMMKNRGPRTKPWEHHKRKYARNRGYQISYEKSELISST